MMKFQSITQGGEQSWRSALYELDPEYYNHDSWKMKMYGDRPIRQPRLSSSYCSSSTSFSSSPSAADQLGNSSINATTTIIGTSTPAQVPSMSNEDMLMNPASSLQVPTLTTMVNSCNELDMLNQKGLNDIGHGGNAFAAQPDVSYQINNRGHPTLSHASHDQSHLSGLAHYSLSANHVETSTAMPYISSTNVEAFSAFPSLPEPVNQHHELHLYEPLYIDYSYFPQCAYNTDHQVLDACNSLQSYAPETAGLGFSHEETNAGHSQLEAAVMSMPLGTCAEKSQSASQSSDPKPQYWGNTYSSINGGGRVSTETFGRSGREAQDFSTPLSTGRADAGLISLSDHNLGAKDKLEHSVDLMGAETETRRWMKLTNPALEAHHNEAFIPNHDQGDEIAALSAGFTTICTAAAGSYGDSGYGPADKADYRMQRQEGERIKEMSIRGSSGLSNMEVQQYITSKTRGVQELLQEAVQGDQNVSSGSTPQSIKAAEDLKHASAERTRRGKQRVCYDTLHTLVPIIPKKRADKVAILKSTIEYIKKLVSDIELQKEKVALGNMNNKNHQGELERYSVNITSQNRSSQTTATCEYIHSSSSREVLPHFRLNLATASAKHVNANDPIIDITTALQNKNLHCFEFKLEFLKSTTSFCATILAVYIKDGKNYTPNLDEMQEIEQWWTHIIDQLSAKWKF